MIIIYKQEKEITEYTWMIHDRNHNNVAFTDDIMSVTTNKIFFEKLRHKLNVIGYNPLCSYKNYIEFIKNFKHEYPEEFI